MSDDVNIRIRATDDASKAFANASASASKFNKVLSGIGAAAAGFGIGFGLNQVVGFIQSATQEFLAARAAGRQLEAVLRSTGRAAGVTAESVNKLAEELQRTTNFDDDLVVRSSAVMLTFTKIGHEVFPEAIKAAANLSAAMGSDLQSAVVQVGKALNDPIKGITALSRVGVSFTAQQKEQIKALINSNQLLEAQKIILSELKTEFSGAAEANSDALTRMGNAWGNFKEKVAGGAIVVIEALNKLRQFAPDLEAAAAMGRFPDQESRPSRFKSVPEDQIVSRPTGLADAIGATWRGQQRMARQGELREFLGSALQRSGVFQPSSRPHENELFGGKAPDIFSGARAKRNAIEGLFGGGRDMFSYFAQQASFMDKPAVEQMRQQGDSNGRFGTSSRFLSTGVGFDPTTQTAKNTAEIVRLTREEKNELARMRRTIDEFARKFDIAGKI